MEEMGRDWVKGRGGGNDHSMTQCSSLWYSLNVYIMYTILDKLAVCSVSLLLAAFFNLHVLYIYVIMSGLVHGAGSGAELFSYTPHILSNFFNGYLI